MLSELSLEQMETVSTVAEEAAREHILSKVPTKRVETLNVTVEMASENLLTLTVEVELTLSPVVREFDSQKLADEAMKKAFTKAEQYLRELTCRSPK